MVTGLVRLKNTHPACCLKLGQPKTKTWSRTRVLAFETHPDPCGPFKPPISSFSCILGSYFLATRGIPNSCSPANVSLPPTGLIVCSQRIASATLKLRLRRRCCGAAAAWTGRRFSRANEAVARFGCRGGEPSGFSIGFAWKCT